MTKQQILNVLQNVGRADLSIPEEKRLSIPHNPLLKPYLQDIADFAQQCRGTAIPALPYSRFKLFYETGDRFQYEDSEVGYFPRRGRLSAFGVQAWLYGREEDLHELEDIIWAICDEYTWSLPAHVERDAFTSRLENDAYMVDLFAAETAQTLAEICFLMGDRIAPIVRLRVERLLNERVFDRVLKQDFGWMTATHNWAAVCGGSVGMAAIYAIEDDDHLAAVLDRVLPAMDSFLAGFAEDGSCLEGIGYWKYGFSYFVAFAELLERRTAGKIRLFEDPRVEKIAAFQQKIYFPGGRTVCFSDGSNRARWFPGLTFFLSRRFEQVTLLPASTCELSYAADHCHRWSTIWRNLIWSDHTAAENMEYRTCQLPAAQWFIGHSPTGAGVAAKGGHNAEPHNHNDVGSFQYYLNGEEMLSDLGSGEYTRQYFSEERYSHFVCGSQGHSVPMIDGCTQREGAEAMAADFEMDETGLRMDMASAYGLKCLTSLQRVLRFDEASGTAELTDSFVLDEEKHDVCERFITYGKVTIEENCALIRLNEQAIRIAYDPAVFAPIVAPVTYSAHMGVEKHLFTLDFHAMAQGAFTARFIITPAVPKKG